MFHELTRVFLWSDSHQERTLVAASAGSESIEVYYALENGCSRHGDSCTVSSHVWYGADRRYWIEEYLVLD